MSRRLARTSRLGRRRLLVTRLGPGFVGLAGSVAGVVVSELSLGCVAIKLENLLLYPVGRSRPIEPWIHSERYLWGSTLPESGLFLFQKIGLNRPSYLFRRQNPNSLVDFFKLLFVLRWNPQSDSRQFAFWFSGCHWFSVASGWIGACVKGCESEMAVFPATVRAKRLTC